MSDTVFLKIQQITQVHKKDIFLSDIAEVYCANRSLESRCKAIKIKKISDTVEEKNGNKIEKRTEEKNGAEGKNKTEGKNEAEGKNKTEEKNENEKKSKKTKKSCQYIGNVMDIIKKIEEIDSSIQIQNLGETDFVVDYEAKHTVHMVWQWIKTLFVCLVSFCGGAFAIMTFNNDANVTQVFGQIYEAIMGEASDGVTALEISYSVGLAAGIVLFFNHFFKWKVTKDPTPLEVEMRLYEDDVNKTLIQNNGRKESGVDVT